MSLRDCPDRKLTQAEVGNRKTRRLDGDDSAEHAEFSETEHPSEHDERRNAKRDLENPSGLRDDGICGYPTPGRSGSGKCRDGLVDRPCPLKHSPRDCGQCAQEGT